VERYNQSIVGALKDISDQVIRIRSLATQSDDADRSVAAARKNYDLSREGYKRGLTDYLNVLIAQNQLLRAQEGVAKIQAERLGAHASLVTALGGGLDEPANGPTATETLPAHGNGKGNALPANGDVAVKPANVAASASLPGRADNDATSGDNDATGKSNAATVARKPAAKPAKGSASAGVASQATDRTRTGNVAATGTTTTTAAAATAPRAIAATPAAE
jgi:hypothetical protein